MASGVKIGEDVKDKYNNDFKKNKNSSFLILKLNDKNTEVVVQETGPKVDSIDLQRGVYEEQFLAKLQEAEELKENRYAFYDFRYKDNNGMEKSKIILIHWNPDGAKIKSKMVYASSCSALLQTLQEEGKKFQQANSLDELDYDALTKELLKHDRA